jgi:hypothetical protein
MPIAEHAAVVDAYRHALSTTFLAGAIIAAIACPRLRRFFAIHIFLVYFSCLGQAPMVTLRQRCRCANLEAQSTAEINSPKFDDLAASFVQLYRSSAGRTPPPTHPTR